MTETESFERIAQIIGFPLSRNTSGKYESEETKLVWQGWKLRADTQAVLDVNAAATRANEIRKNMGWDK